MKFRKAKQDDKEEILALYQSLIGTPYCAWGNGYPGEQEFDYDMKRNALFCMENEDGEIIGTITVDEDPQVEALTCWSKTLQPSAELSRLGVRTDMQNQGIARQLLQHGMEELKKQGTNINQIARILNSGGTVELGKLEEFTAEYKKLNELIGVIVRRL